MRYLGALLIQRERSILRMSSTTRVDERRKAMIDIEVEGKDSRKRGKGK